MIRRLSRTFSTTGIYYIQGNSLDEIYYKAIKMNDNTNSSEINIYTFTEQMKNKNIVIFDKMPLIRYNKIEQVKWAVHKLDIKKRTIFKELVRYINNFKLPESIFDDILVSKPDSNSRGLLRCVLKNFELFENEGKFYPHFNDSGMIIAIPPLIAFQCLFSKSLVSHELTLSILFTIREVISDKDLITILNSELENNVNENIPFIKDSIYQIANYWLEIYSKVMESDDLQNLRNFCKCSSSHYSLFSTEFKKKIDKEKAHESSTNTSLKSPVRRSKTSKKKISRSESVSDMTSTNESQVDIDIKKDTKTTVDGKPKLTERLSFTSLSTVDQQSEPFIASSKSPIQSPNPDLELIGTEVGPDGIFKYNETETKTDVTTETFSLTESQKQPKVRTDFYRFIDIKTSKIAEQFFVYDLKLIKELTIGEIILQTESFKTYLSRISAIDAMVNSFIDKEKSPSVFSYFISVAKSCLTIGEYNISYIISCTLKNKSTTYKQAFEAVKGSYISDFKYLEETFPLLNLLHLILLVLKM
ncbi:hypothetical protein EDI_339190 [Entamoeba dispar SAW760]|uniref:Uncharacterized protein n=1 Tax=Entamoeba dispar (strain ATCC PRA-260 / SAW760) TaxID=370354 RepID=B0E7U8_ENTDS|nr:uncharacterized protein EDI_339190 [Entamoeba dispar SAW760]EDR29420.1 hypothetical protein EDI_339190 [Entamoeba dispar SAW760]|eukprot:EDR29420.1 hypothetical protein EDI_339190 [Entamoeba dispar SAW760]